MKSQLTRLRISGFRSLRDVELELTPLTLLIGANGAGKTNLLGAMELLERCAAGFLPLHVGLHGGASYLLHKGSKAENRIEIEVELWRDSERWGYAIVLSPTAADAFVFEIERVGHAPSGKGWSWTDLGQGHTESRLVRQDRSSTADTVRELLAGLRLYHFHDTSRVSELRAK